MQSTNEELETAKEELQSSNEELQTLNEELKNRNLALGRLNDDLANLQTNIDVPVVIVDNDLKIRRFTASALELLKILPSDVGRSITSINLGVHDVDFEKIITDVITKLSAVKQEVGCSEGRLCEMRVRPYLTEEKKIDGAVLSFTDITERKKADASLKEIKDQLELQINRMPIGFIVWDKDFKVTSWNPAAEHIFGYSARDIMGKHPYGTIVPKGAQTRVEKIWHRLLEGDETANSVNDNLTKDGKRITCSWSNTPLKRDDNTVIGVLSMVQDITERKKAEDALAMQAELIDLSPDAIIVRKLDGTITFWSKGAEKLYGWTKNEAIGQDINILLKTDFPQPIKEILNRIKLDGKWSGNIVHICKNGSRLVVQSCWLGKIDNDGNLVEMLESNVDITELLQVQAKLEESSVRVEEYANQMEELANKRAEQLKAAERLAAIGATAGMVGHDIRNPLQAITGDVYLAKTELALTLDSAEKKSIQESLTEIENNIDYINKIVQDLQDFAKNLKPNAEKIDLKLIIDELLEKNGLQENVKVSVKVEKDARKIVADSTFIKRILFNLVNNAVQAMPNGGELTTHIYKEANDVLITVKDTGVGVPEAIKNKLFTPMFTTKAKGQGFGLPVIKRLTESLGGTVTFESQEGKGTTFSVRLPQKAKQ